MIVRLLLLLAVVLATTDGFQVVQPPPRSAGHGASFSTSSASVGAATARRRRGSSSSFSFSSSFPTATTTTSLRFRPINNNIILPRRHNNGDHYHNSYHCLLASKNSNNDYEDDAQEQDPNIIASMLTSTTNTVATSRQPKGNNNNRKTSSSIDWAVVKKNAVLFKDMTGPYFLESKTARWLAAGLLALTLLNSGVSVLFSFLGKEFWNALSAKDTEVFYNVLLKYCGALVVGAPVVTLYRYQRKQLSVHWREWMTARTVSLYVTNRVYYNLERGGSRDDDDENEIDNPDQRIAEDVNSFTSYSLSLVITVLTSIIDLASFSTILYGIYPLLCGVIVAYALVGTLSTIFVGRKLVGLNFDQLLKEANFRYSLVRLRDNAENIAFYAGEDLEGQAVEARLESVMSNQRDINRQQLNVEVLTNSYNYLVQILPVAVVAPKYFAGDIELGVISQSVGAFNHILSDLSIIVNQFEGLSSFSAGLERLASFYEAMRDADVEREKDTPLLQLLPSNNTSVINGEEEDAKDNATAAAVGTSRESETNVDNKEVIEATAITALVDATANPFSTAAAESFGTIEVQSIPSNNDGEDANDSESGKKSSKTQKHNNNVVLKLDNLDLCTPDKKRVLIRDLSLEISEGQHLLIVGNSGTGKSSLLRGIAGLWTSGNGRIGKPDNEDVYFLPQRPYCTLGSLKDQILYPMLDIEKVETIEQEEAIDGESDEDETKAEKKKKKMEVKKKKAQEEKNKNKILPRSHFRKQELTDEDLLDVLEKVNLLDVATRAGDGNATAGLSAVLDWSNLLSLGEQQRLAFGRLLVNQPKLVILDEATSALDLVSEARMYTLLQNMAQKRLSKTDNNNGANLSRPGLTYISVGHRPSLMAFHDKRLRLRGEDGYEFEHVEKEKSNIVVPTGGL